MTSRKISLKTSSGGYLQFYTDDGVLFSLKAIRYGASVHHVTVLPMKTWPAVVPYEPGELQTPLRGQKLQVKTNFNNKNLLLLFLLPQNLLCPLRYRYPLSLLRKLRKEWQYRKSLQTRKQLPVKNRSPTLFYTIMGGQHYKLSFNIYCWVMEMRQLLSRQSFSLSSSV